MAVVWVVAEEAVTEAEWVVAEVVTAVHPVVVEVKSLLIFEKNN